jgi:hypothetical protein
VLSGEGLRVLVRVCACACGVLFHGGEGGSDRGCSSDSVNTSAVCRPVCRPVLVASHG